MLLEHLLAVLFKIATEKVGPELGKHGLVETRPPIPHLCSCLQFGFRRAPVNRLHCRAKDGLADDFGKHAMISTHACHESTSRVVMMILASGYASISSLQNAMAGQSHTACGQRKHFRCRKKSVEYRLDNAPKADPIVRAQMSQPHHIWPSVHPSTLNSRSDFPRSQTSCDSNRYIRGA